MATSVGKLVVTLTARTTKFGKRMQAASKLTKMFAGGMFRAAKAVSAAAVLGGAGLAFMIKKQLTAIDETQKLATALDTTAAGIAALQFAGNIAGVTTEELTKSFAKMEKGIGQARQGLAAQKKAFDDLGLSTDTLAKQDASKTFIEILSALAKLPTAADRAATATDIFGRAGLKLLPLASEGAKGIRSLVAEAKELGLTFTNKAAKGVEDANDEITRAKATFIGLARTITTALAPAITTAAKKFTEFGKGVVANAPAITLFVKNFVEDLSRADGFLGSILQGIKAITGFGDVGKSATAFTADIAKIDAKLADLARTERNVATKAFTFDFAKGTRAKERRGLEAERAQKVRARTDILLQKRFDKLEAARKEPIPQVPVTHRRVGLPSLLPGRPAPPAPAAAQPTKAEQQQISILQSIDQRLKTGVPAVAA